MPSIKSIAVIAVIVLATLFVVNRVSFLKNLVG
jgi:hypothetical protein